MALPLADAQRGPVGRALGPGAGLGLHISGGFEQQMLPAGDGKPLVLAAAHLGSGSSPGGPAAFLTPKGCRQPTTPSGAVPVGAVGLCIHPTTVTSCLSVGAESALLVQVPPGPVALGRDLTLSLSFRGASSQAAGLQGWRGAGAEAASGTH